MKPVLAWIKANPMIVIFSAIILVILPASWFGSSWWSGKIRTNQEATAKKDWDKIQGSKVDYVVNSFEPGQAALSHKDVPNRALIAWIKQQREELSTQAGALVKKAEDFNKGVGADAAAVGRTEHKPLVDGLFPVKPLTADEKAAGQTDKDKERAKLDEMEDTLLGAKGKPNPYQALLTQVRAGSPTDPIRMAEIISDMKTRESEKITAGKRELTTDEQAALAKQLSDRRLAEYEGRTSGMSVYASLDSFPHDTRGVFIPSGAHMNPTDVEPYRLFQFQWDYWVYRDLFAAVRLANSGPDGKLKNIDQSAVKRIVSINLDPPEGLDSVSEGGDPSRLGSDRAQFVPTPTTPGMVALDSFRSITGRSMGSWNTVYDVRRGTIVVIVSSAHLQDFLESIPRTNFMTVTGLNLSDVNVWSDLRSGYYYGPEHVVRATVDVETVWLRSWMTQYMPSRLKAQLKIPEPPPAATDPNAAAPANKNG